MTQQVTLRLATDAADLLAQLAPSQYKRGWFMSELIRQEAARRGLVAATPAEPEPVDLAAVQQQLRDLQEQVSRAIAQQGQENPPNSGHDV